MFMCALFIENVWNIARLRECNSITSSIIGCMCREGVHQMTPRDDTNSKEHSLFV